MRRLLALVCAIVLVDTMLFSTLTPLLHHYKEDFGLSKAGAGVLLATYAAGAFSGAIPGGLVAARVGPKRAALFGLVLMSAASVGFGLAGDEWTLGTARFVQGFGSALSWAGGFAWLVAATPRSRRGEMLGTAIGAAVLGALLGPVLGAIVSHAGARPVFVAVALLGVGLIAWALSTPGVAPHPERGRPLGSAILEPDLLVALWLMALPALLFGVLAVLVSLELGDAGWSTTAVGAVFLAGTACESVMNPLLGRLSDRRGRLEPVRIALVGSIAISLALAWSGRPGVVAALVVAASLAYGAFFVPAATLVSDGAERVGLPQGLGFGLSNAAWAAGSLAGPASAGGLAQISGDVVPYLLSAAVCVATFFLLRPALRSGTLITRVPESP